MSNHYSELDETLKFFIQKQKMFFVGTAGVDGRVNVSPKGLDSLRILNSKQVAWINYTGSGNETAAHILECNRMTLMFCAFEGKPNILRLYGKAQAIHPRDSEWDESIKLFPDIPGARQIFLMEIESLSTSCGYSVPLFEFKEDRDSLVKWAKSKGQEGIEQYWREKNLKSIDDKPTNIFGN